MNQPQQATAEIWLTWTLDTPRKQCTTGEIKEEILKVSARLDEAEGRIENTEVAMIEKIKLQVKVVTTLIVLSHH